MEPRKAIEVIIKMRNKYSFNKEEEQAMLTSIGVLDSAALSINRIKGIIKNRINKFGRSTKRRR